MNILFDEKQLLQLIRNLHILTGMKANILDTQGKDIRLYEHHPPFCKAVNGRPEGHERCVACDMRSVKAYAADRGFQFYRCHAGICEAVMPLFDKSRPLAYLIFGCFLDDSPIEEQWDNTRALLAEWWPGDLEALHRAFLQFRQYTQEELQAYAEILEALSAYIRIKDMILSAEQTDLEKLEQYLDQRYMERLSLDSISKDLHIGRTKLCALAKELSGGRTLSWLIAQRRIGAAKRLLLQSDMPIAGVAEAVGISDYNYFTKVFRSVAGTTPSAFRKRVGNEEKL